MGGAPGFRVRSFRFVDPSRTIRLPDGRRVLRPLETVVRYPAGGRASADRLRARIRAHAGSLRAPLDRVDAGRLRRRRARVSARERERAGRPDPIRPRQRASGRQLRHHKAARPRRAPEWCARRKNRSVADRGCGPLRRRRRRARGRLRPTVPRPAPARGDRDVGCGASLDWRVFREGAAPRSAGDGRTRSTRRRRPPRTSCAHTVRSSCSGCSERHTGRPTHFRNPSSGLSNG